MKIKFELDANEKYFNNIMIAAALTYDETMFDLDDLEEIGNYLIQYAEYRRRPRPCYGECESQ